MSHNPGIDGRGLAVFAWCSCGWNRTKLTRGLAREAIREHTQWWDAWEHRKGSTDPRPRITSAGTTVAVVDWVLSAAERATARDSARRRLSELVEASPLEPTCDFREELNFDPIRQTVTVWYWVEMSEFHL